MLPALVLMAAHIMPPVASTTPPVCETVQVYENSTEGPNYKIRLCGDVALPIKTLIVDGSKLPEKTETKWKPVVFWYRPT